MSFEVSGPGRYDCPACGTPNDVRQSPAPPEEGLVTPAPPPAPDQPAPRLDCTECGLRFIVGDVEEAPCPNCGTMVTVAGNEEGDE